MTKNVVAARLVGVLLTAVGAFLIDDTSKREPAMIMHATPK